MKKKESQYEEGYYEISIDEISLDPNNPRHDSVKDESSVLEALLKTKNFKNKIITLMKDILEYNQNPLDVIGVLLTENNTLYSKEGNRRIAALKILNNPELIRYNDTALYSRVQNLLNDYSIIPNKVYCYVTKNADQLDHAIELKHQGEQNGSGTVSWGSEEKARHRRNKGKHDSIYAFLNTLEEKKILLAKVRRNITKTNWERIFTKDALEWLGVKKNGDDYEIVDEKMFTPKFRALTTEIENKTHHIVNDKIAREKLFKQLDDQLKVQINDVIPKIEDGDKKIEKKERKEELEKSSDENSTTDDAAKSNGKNSDSKGKEKEDDERQKPLVKETPSKFRLHELYISKNSKIDSAIHTSIVNILDELKSLSGGNYRKYKLSTYYLIRALIEQTLKYWLSAYYPNIYKKCVNNQDTNLGKMIEQINKGINNSTDIFFDKSMNRKFLTFFGNYASKDNLDLLVHHPYMLSPNIDTLHSYTSGILFDILNYILTYEENGAK